MPSVYLETTIPSFLVARISQEDGLAEKQAITRTWWEDPRRRYELVTSEIVLEEAALGDESQSTSRLRNLTRVRILGPTEDVEFIGNEFVQKGWIPPAYRTLVTQLGKARPRHLHTNRADEERPWPIEPTPRSRTYPVTIPCRARVSIAWGLTRYGEMLPIFKEPR
jgi:hypothetical protein